MREKKPTLHIRTYEALETSNIAVRDVAVREKQQRAGGAFQSGFGAEHAMHPCCQKAKAPTPDYASRPNQGDQKILWGRGNLHRFNTGELLTVGRCAAGRSMGGSAAHRVQIDT